MAKRYIIHVEPIEPSGVVLTIAELPRIVIFGETAEDALGWAREAIAFQLRDSPDGDRTPPLELILGRASDDLPSVHRCPRRSPRPAAHADLGGTSGSVATCSAP